MSNRVYLALGSNVGDRELHLRRALDELRRRGLDVLQCSSLYETAPQDVLEQPWFLNQVVEAQTELTPQEVLGVIQAIEQAAGRRRTIARGPRTLDIDILLYADANIDEPELTVPHPRMQQRRFVLEPLHEIAPQLVGPALLERVKDQPLRRL